MNELVVADRATEWRRLKALVLELRPAGITKATMMAWRVALDARGLGPISIKVRITAVRKLAVEAADNGLLAPELAFGIARIKGVPSHGPGGQLALAAPGAGASERSRRSDEKRLPRSPYREGLKSVF